MNPMDSVQCYPGWVALIFPTGQEIKLSMAKLWSCYCHCLVAMTGQ